MKKILIIAGLLVSQIAFSANAVETLVWDKYPLKFELPVNKERIISFDKATQLEIPPKVSDLIEFSILEGKNYYLKAKKPFKRTRIFATAEDGQQFIFDVSGRWKASTAMIEVVDKKTAVKRIDEEKKQHKARVSSVPTMSINDQYIRLTRYASQQSYAPRRVINPEPDVSRVKVPKNNFRMFRQSPQIIGKPISQFYSSVTGLYVTTLELSNTASYGVALDPRTVRGDFLTATTQHGFLSKAGTKNSSSALYVISNKSFKEAMGAWVTN